MRGKLRDLIPTPNLPSVSRPSIPDGVRVTGVLGVVALLMTISAAGVLSGAGIFLLAMVAMEAARVILAALVLSFSSAVFLLCYGWLTA
jgi:hypothetical protein